MFGKVSRYDEHPSKLKTYRDVVGRSATPSTLPLLSESTGSSPWHIIMPLVLLFLIVTELCLLWAPSMFLGWLTHSLIFLILGAIVYHLCPPQWTERVEVNEREVVFEFLGFTGYRVDRIPLAQYRGLIPITHSGTASSGTKYREYGVALRHADPTKTVILSLSSIYHEHAVNHFAQLLNVKPLRDEKFALSLESKRATWRAKKDQSHAI